MSSANSISLSRYNFEKIDVKMSKEKSILKYYNYNRIYTENFLIIFIYNFLFVYFLPFRISLSHYRLIIYSFIHISFDGIP